MGACPHQLLFLKGILNTFVDSTGLKVNYSKSNMYPINLSQERLNHLTSTFNCKIGVFPFTYLGLPLSMNKPTVQDCMPLISRIERRLVNTSNFLTQGGKLELVNSVLSSMTKFYMCSIKVPIEILDQINKYKSYCLWNCGDTNERKIPLIAWKKVTRPKMKGGFGVIKLRVQNEALLLKNLHKFINRADLPWVQLIWAHYYPNGKIPSPIFKGSFWWKGMLRLLTQNKGLAYGVAGSEHTTLF
jgi:hypothetical protein